MINPSELQPGNLVLYHDDTTDRSGVPSLVSPSVYIVRVTPLPFGSNGSLCDETSCLTAHVLPMPLARLDMGTINEARVSCIPINDCRHESTYRVKIRGESAAFEGDIRYAHELQNALTLCGLGDTAAKLKDCIVND